ncbi:MAG: RagB/SusD family nutrient uptake outer membrane protein [Bacteroidales bacterium]|nr:RagB/SusD family nutrient uptake outer membrane protein [Bacteroidales bacterium]
MKMKNSILVWSSATLLFLTSCVGLEQYPTNSYTDDTYWLVPANVDAALNLGYNQCWNADLYWCNNLLSDDVFGSRHSGDNLLVATGLATTSNGRFSSEWNGCYQELRTLHTALDNLDRMNIDDATKARYEAEWRLMRAFTYLRLITWFGDVPFFTTNPTLPETKVVSRSPEAEIRQFILDELEFAAGRLPLNTQIPATEYGRYTAGTAVAIKARAYLLNNDWANCAAECARLINGTEYGSYRLADNYASLFTSGHYGPESIMTIEFAYEGSANHILRSWSTGQRLPQSIGYGGIVEFSPTQELVDAFRKTNGSVAGDTDYADRDLRFYSTIAYNGCTLTIPPSLGAKIIGSEGVGRGTYTCWTRPEDAEIALRRDPSLKDAYDGSQDRTATGYYNIKNYAPETIGPGGGSYKPIMEIRFADVLLMYAESMNELGEMTDEIWNKTIQPLRRRAGFNDSWCNTIPASQEEKRQAIREERRCELALEGRRCFDLRRWAVLDNPSIRETGSAYLTSTATGAPFQDDGSRIVCQSPYSIMYWFPIPQSERDINKNLTQNPGW